MPSEIKLPKLKENVEAVEVSEVLVAPDEEVAKDQPLIVVNADKSNMEVSSPVAGKVVQLRVKVGDEIKIGDVYCVIEGSNGDEAPAKKDEKPAEPKKPAPAPAKAAVKKGEATDEPRPRDVQKVARDARPTAPPEEPPPLAPHPGGIVPAGPATRWLARKLGVDLRQVRGSGPHGRVTEDDVKGFFGDRSPGRAGPGVQEPPLPNFEQFGPVRREGLSRVRKLTAQKMSLSWSLIPHVTQHDIADITDLEAFRKQREGKGPKLTVTAFALKACAAALKRFPVFNSSLDLASGQLVFKDYYHLGVAVDTKGGLLVPVLRDVDKKGVEQLAQELGEVAEQARQGQADMAGGTFTVTNLGGIGGTAFTPIINHPEVAILGMSRSRWQPTVRDGQVVPRLLLPLSLSYDHRVIDGAAAARFTRAVADMLENPWVMVLHA